MLTRAVVLGVWLAVALPSAALAQSPPQIPRDGPHRLLVSSGQVAAAADGGWGCWTVGVSPEGPPVNGVCADPAPDWDRAPASSVPAPVDGKLIIEAGARLDRMEVMIGSTSLVPRALDDSGRRFAVTLPPGTPPSFVVRITIHYSNFAREDGHFESGTLTFAIRVRERQKEFVPRAAPRVTPIMVTTPSSARCRPGPRGARCRFVQSGRVLRPPGSVADCAGGQVVVRAAAGRKTLLRARARTSRDCRYRIRAPFRHRRRLSVLKVSTRFLGTPSLRPQSAKPTTVRIRSF
ncbi:MAG: hypothetical protein M3131_04355 [Actinomycetota bacterium]|nr:hypothetical protein [Actinomycetota bacterium]